MYEYKHFIRNIANREKEFTKYNHNYRGEILHAVRKMCSISVLFIIINISS